MRWLARERLPYTLFLLGASAIGPAAILHYLGPEPHDLSGEAHVIMVGIAAVATAIAAGALTITGAKRGDARSVMLGTAFTVMTALLFVHGLATPGVIAPPNGVIKFAGAASLPVGAALLALAALPALRGPQHVRATLVFQGVLLALVLGMGITALVVPELVPRVPETGSAEAWAVVAGGVALFGMLAFRAARTYTLTRRLTDFLVVMGTVWLAVALFPQLLMQASSMSMYLAHALEILGLSLVAVPVALDLRRAGGWSRPLVGDLTATDLVAQEEAFLGARIGRLMLDLADKDRSTEMHTRRVATLGVRMGERLGLSPARLRVLAVGGLLHDIGKLAVPTAVLQKPGALDDDEFAEIKKHPQAGADLLGALGGFSWDVRRLVLDHHERLDGSGYPRGITSADLDLETRILAVADVYDALVSDRVYRQAWTHERALGLLHEGAGMQFDSACLRALEDVTERLADEPVRATRRRAAAVPQAATRAS